MNYFNENFRLGCTYDDKYSYREGILYYDGDKVDFSDDELCLVDIITDYLVEYKDKLLNFFDSTLFMPEIGVLNMFYMKNAIDGIEPSEEFLDYLKICYKVIDYLCELCTEDFGFSNNNILRKIEEENDSEVVNLLMNIKGRFLNDDRFRPHIRLFVDTWLNIVIYMSGILLKKIKYYYCNTFDYKYSYIINDIKETINYQIEDLYGKCSFVNRDVLELLNYKYREVNPVMYLNLYRLANRGSTYFYHSKNNKEFLVSRATTRFFIAIILISHISKHNVKLMINIFLKDYLRYHMKDSRKNLLCYKSKEVIYETIVEDLLSLGFNYSRCSGDHMIFTNKVTGHVIPVPNRKLGRNESMTIRKEIADEYNYLINLMLEEIGKNLEENTMANFYAVKQGRKTGIFSTWGECEKQVKGFKGAKHKKFKSEAQAKKYLGETNKKPIDINKGYVFYVDGSYNEELNQAGWGLVILRNGEMIDALKGTIKEGELDLSQRNIVGELIGAIATIQQAKQRKIKEYTLCFDLEGIESWVTGDWNAENQLTQGYKNIMLKAMNEGLKITFNKVKGHSGDKWNDYVDNLAKQAAGVL